MQHSLNQTIKFKKAFNSILDILKKKQVELLERTAERFQFYSRYSAFRAMDIFGTVTDLTFNSILDIL